MEDFFEWQLFCGYIGEVGMWQIDFAGGCLFSSAFVHPSSRSDFVGPGRTEIASPLKIDGWNTIVSFRVPAYFQGQKVKLQVGTGFWFRYIPSKLEWDLHPNGPRSNKVAIELLDSQGFFGVREWKVGPTEVKMVGCVCLTNCALNRVKEPCSPSEGLGQLVWFVDKSYQEASYAEVCETDWVHNFEASPMSILVQLSFQNRSCRAENRCKKPRAASNVCGFL